MPKNEFDKIILEAVREVIPSEKKQKKIVSEAYVVQAKKFTNHTAALSDKAKESHQKLLEGYVDALNATSAKLDGADRETANANDSEFRSLKLQEAHNLNAAFLHGLFFENVGDMQSKITTDSLTFMRLERDFGTFDAWQKDFIACAMSARNGWALTCYNTFLRRYINVVVDLHDLHIPIGSIPVIVMDVWEHAYYRDYLNDRKSYIYAMMKELNWSRIEERFENMEIIGKVQ